MYVGILMVSIFSTLVLQADTACRKDFVKFKGSCYLLVKKDVSWEEARTSCRNKGAKMLAIETAQEQKFLAVFLAKYAKADYLWTSGTDKGSEGVWRWDGWHKLIQKSPRFWLPTEPDESPIQNYLCIDPRRWSQWADCFEKLYDPRMQYVCEYRLATEKTTSHNASG